MKKVIDPTTAFIRAFALDCAMKFNDVPDCQAKYTAFVKWWLQWWLNEHHVVAECKPTLEVTLALFSASPVPNRKQWIEAAGRMTEFKDKAQRLIEGNQIESPPLSEVLTRTREVEAGLAIAIATALQGEVELYNAVRAYHKDAGNLAAGNRVRSSFVGSVAGMVRGLVLARVAHEHIQAPVRTKITQERVLLVILTGFLDAIE